MTGTTSGHEPSHKVRIGFGLGTATNVDGPRLNVVVDELERYGFDSLWFSERIGSNAPDPLVAMSYTLGRTTNLKTGMSVMVLPGRNPVVLAKAFASLAVIAPKRVLPAFGLGAVDPNEQQAFGVERGERASRFDEAMAVMRACWHDDTVTFHGQHFHLDEVRVYPKPEQLDVWLGGNAPSELRRVARLADGWLPSFITPEEFTRDRMVIERMAADHGREIEADHYGVLIPYSFDPLPDLFVERFSRRRPDVDLRAVTPDSWESLSEAISRYIDAGASKFVVLPLSEPTSPDAWTEHLGQAAATLLPLETPAPAAT